ncbi:MAG: FAD-binding oxidoreductase [bacterium]
MDLTSVPRATDAARFGMSGQAPARGWRPESATEVADAVRTAAAEGLRLVPWGGGVALSREPAPAHWDVALDLSALRRITIHDPEDFTVTAECGIVLADLREALAAHRQELPLEGAEAWGATLGGVLAANASGPRRLALGAPRDRILGARFVTGDGVLARSGGRVVKNVAGHAVHRLLVGSRGALGVLVEASLKLPPHPTGRLALVWGQDAAGLAAAARWAGWPRREPAVLTVLGRALAALHPVLASDAPFAVVAGFEDDPAWLAACQSFARDTVGAPRLSVRDASVPTLWQQVTDPEEMPGPRLSFTSPHRTPDAIAPIAHRPVAERLLFHAACGRLHVWPEPGEAAALVTELAGHGFTLLESRGVTVPEPAVAPAIAELRTRLRAALDPSGVFARTSR